MKQQSLSATFRILLLLCICIGFNKLSYGQQSLKSSKNFFKYRSNNLIELGGGFAIPNVDFPDPQLEVDFMVGYERFIWPRLSVQVLYHKFNLATSAKFNEGFMSFDLNIKSLLIPYNRISPYIFIGGGYNASNYFEQDGFKIQAGGGFEIILTKGLGLVLFADYNYLFFDDIEGFEAGDGNDTFIRAGMGFNIYFGFGRDRRLDGKKTIINSNPIRHDY